LSYQQIIAAIQPKKRESMLDLSSIEERVTANPQTQSPTATTSVELPKPNPQVEQALRDEVAQLRREQAAALATAEANLCSERLRVAREQAHFKPSEKVGRGRADLELNRAIAACGGLAFWSKLSPTQQAEALGIRNSEQVKDSELKILFGAKSSSIKANSLAKSDPLQYRRLRTLSQLRNIL
jgi:hypothetical protein